MFFTDHSKISPFAPAREQKYIRTQLIEKTTGFVIEDFAYIKDDGIPSEEQRRVNNFMQDGIYELINHQISREEFVELMSRTHGDPVIYRFGRV